MVDSGLYGRCQHGKVKRVPICVQCSWIQRAHLNICTMHSDVDLTVPQE